MVKHYPNFTQIVIQFLQLLSMEKIEHVGIAVKDLATAIPLYEQLLQTQCYKTETIETEQVITAFFKVGDSKIELLQSISPNGVIAKYIEKKGEGMHHIAYAVQNIVAEMDRLKANGFSLLNDAPKKGADNKWVCFVHPKTANGVLVELCEEMGTV
jgi:methylmalonyl-CoA/ethylmalonyl-CoA epimerase